MTDLQALQWVLLPAIVGPLGIIVGGCVQHAADRRKLRAAFAAPATMVPDDPFPPDATFRAAWRAIAASEPPEIERARIVRRPPSVVPDRPEPPPPPQHREADDLATGAELPDWCGAVAA